tara:strand:+ start:31 stop:708 length:678 start_codon:yes stop_codon:yes gene_type:complete
MKEAVELLYESPWFYLLGIVLAGTYFYFKKKFENLADKEDVSDITREVESVKKEFIEDLEKLKYNLEILKSHKINLVSDKRKTIYDFWSSINLLYIKVDAFNNYQIEDFESYYKYLDDVNKADDSFVLNRSIFELKLNRQIKSNTKQNIFDFVNIINNLRADTRVFGLKTVDFMFRLNNQEAETKEFGELMKLFSEKKKPYYSQINDILELINEDLITIIEELHS